MSTQTNLNLISKEWETERLILSDASLGDSDKLQYVYEDHFSQEWLKDGLKMDPSYMKKYIVDPELPPKGIRKRQRLQVIRLKRDNSVIGYLDIYHGWPRKDIFWIGDLFFLNTKQNKGYGQEIIQELARKVAMLDTYEYMRCNVSLKNWPGLRFWFKAGFSEIVGYLGDRRYGLNSYADITLEMKVKSNSIDVK